MPEKTAVSAVVTTYNGLKLLRKHLPAVLACLRPGDELVIVDDASSDSSVAYLIDTYKLDSESLQGSFKRIKIRVLVNKINQRFAASCNRGVVVASNPLIFLLNNDVSPEADVLEHLLPHFAEKTVFAVGCKELAASEGDKEYGRAEGAFKRGFLVHQRCEDQNDTETLWVAGGSGLFRRFMWMKLHGFDLDYKPAYWEDIDLSWRAREKGWQVLFEPKAIVHHVHESSNASVFGKRRIEIMAYKNSLLFMWKNARGMVVLEHLFWLPYHLIFTTIRSRGTFLLGFWEAIKTVV